MNSSEWLHDPELNSIPKAKEKIEYLIAILQATEQTPDGKPKNMKEMLPFLLTIHKKAKESNISFQKDELQLILKIMEKYATPDEIKKLEVVSSYFR